MRTGLSRRRFLLLASWLLGGVALPGGARARGGIPLMELLAAIEVEREPLAFYAEAYLAAHPAERDPAALRKALPADTGADGAEEFRRRLETQVRADFAAGRTVNLDGWILATTEVRLWCLYHLLTK